MTFQQTHASITGTGQWLVQHGYIDSDWSHFKDYQASSRHKYSFMDHGLRQLNTIVDDQQNMLSQASAVSVNVNPTEVVDITVSRASTSRGIQVVICSDMIPIWFAELQYLWNGREIDIISVVADSVKEPMFTLYALNFFDKWMAYGVTHDYRLWNYSDEIFICPNCRAVSLNDSERQDAFYVNDFDWADFVTCQNCNNTNVTEVTTTRSLVASTLQWINKQADTGLRVDVLDEMIVLSVDMTEVDEHHRHRTSCLQEIEIEVGHFLRPIKSSNSPQTFKIEFDGSKIMVHQTYRASFAVYGEWIEALPVLMAIFSGLDDVENGAPDDPEPQPLPEDAVTWLHATSEMLSRADERRLDGDRMVYVVSDITDDDINDILEAQQDGKEIEVADGMVYVNG